MTDRLVSVIVFADPIRSVLLKGREVMYADKQKLTLAMARACMSAKGIAKQANMPESTVKNVLTGRSIRPCTLGKVARALGVDVTDILTEVNR